MISRFGEVAGELPRDAGEDTAIYNMTHNGFVQAGCRGDRGDRDDRGKE